MLGVGDMAADFYLPGVDGKEHRLSDYSGKWVVLYFYPKDNTSGCTKEAIDFTELLDSFRELNAVVIGISPDSIESHKKFADKHDLKITLLSDSSKDVLREYGAWGTKKNYGREYEGVIRTTFLISPGGRIEKVWRKVKVRVKRRDREIRHAEVVKDFLEALRN